jgi:hypothetical protein
MAVFRLMAGNFSPMTDEQQPMIKPLLILTIIVSGLFVLALHLHLQSAAALTEAEGILVLKNTESYQRVPVLVELFTSEGCSSCPLADALLEKLVRTQPVPGAEIIALSEHVDYWNYIGWSDPFSSAQFSQRQQTYSIAFQRDGAYTPQMVVDGQAEFVGSNPDKARQAITQAITHAKAKVEIHPTVNPQAGFLKLNVTVSDLPATSDKADVMLAITESNLASDVVRGENSGRKLRHVSVVRLLSKVGETKSRENFTAAPEIRLATDWKRENLRAVIFIQQRNQRRVLGAGSVTLQS